MTDDDILAEFLVAPLEAQLSMITDPDRAPLLRARLGPDAFAELAELAGQSSGGPVLSDHATNLIVVPGIMGSVLVSEGLGGVWWIDALRGLGQLDSLGLSADGSTDLVSDADIKASTLDLVYIPFRLALRNREDLGQIGYPYDWRKPIPTAAEGLAAVVESAYGENGGQPIHLAAHSMGGLVVRAALMQHPELWSKVGRIAFMGTPHYGSPAIAGYLKHHFWGLNLFHLLGRHLTARTFRSMWGALSLLPAPAGTYPGTRAADGDTDDPRQHPCANFDLYDAAAYRLELPPAELDQLQAILDHAADFHRDLATWHRALPQEQRDRMLVIAGVGQKTLFRLAYKASIFGLGWEQMDRVTRRDPGNRHREGDGRVPVASAALEHVRIRYVKAEHSELPKLPAVQREVFAWCTGGALSLATTPQGALAANLDGDDRDATPALSGPRNDPNTADDPGYLDFDDPVDGRLDELEARLIAGSLPEFERLRLL